MTPETMMHLLNYSIIVLLCTIGYCIALIIVRAARLVRRINQREREFLQGAYYLSLKAKADALHDHHGDRKPVTCEKD